MDAGFLLKNKILDIVVVSMLIAQLYKFFSTIVIKKQVVWSRLWETGGMPSSHSSSVVALTTAIAIIEGTSSLAFAISVVFSVVVMYDAAGIRKAAGEHAGVINQITDFFSLKYDKKFNNEKLKELLGHSRLEVVMGAILGFLVAFLMRGYLQN
jgi:acid phosphatase family membrane protein YuiD